MVTSGFAIYDTMQYIGCPVSTVCILAWRRPWRRAWSRRQTGIALIFGLVTIAMNIAIYEAISRIPLGTAVAIEFLGPTAVAALWAHVGRRESLAAVALASVGVLLLVGVGVRMPTWTGVLFRVGVGRDVGRVTSCSASGWQTPATASIPSRSGWSLAALGAGARHSGASTGSALTRPSSSIRELACSDFCIGLLSTAIPYALDQLVLVSNRGARKFALLLALLPVTATLIGVAVFGQIPTLLEIVGITLVVIALLLSAREASEAQAEGPRSPLI